jgi:hypothetical protein
MEKLKYMKEVLTDAVFEEIGNLKNADTKELGEDIDMVKDLEEAIYYCTITKAMEEKEYSRNSERMYYDGPNTGSTHSSRTYMQMGDPYHDYPSMEYPVGMRDSREGRSPMTRRTYMESKEMHKDKTIKMQELEKYMQELTKDMVEMIEDASPEEKQLLQRKITMLGNKIEQTNG